MSMTKPTAAENCLPLRWVLAASVVIILMASYIAIKSASSVLWLVGLGACCLAVLIWLSFRPSPLEILFFILPMVWPLIPAATGIAPIVITILWVVAFLTIWFVKETTGNYLKTTVRTTFIYPLIVYTIIFILATFSNPVSSVAFSTYSQLIALIVFYWIFSQTLRSQDLNRIVTAMILGAVAGSVLFLIVTGQVMLLFALEGLAYGGLIRPTPLGYNANSWAYIQLIGVPLLMARVVHDRRDWRRNLVWMIPSGLLMFAVLIIIGSRSAILGVFLASLFAVVISPQARKFFLVVGAGIASLLVMIKPEILSLLGKVARVGTGLSGRGQIWQAVLDMVQSSPFVGFGPGWLKTHYFFYIPFVAHSLRFTVDRPSPHNAYLNIAADLGIFATIVVVFILILFVRRSWLIWKCTKNGNYLGLLIAINAVMLAGFVRSLFEVDFIVPHGYLTENLILITLLAIQDQLYGRVVLST